MKTYTKNTKDISKFILEFIETNKETDPSLLKEKLNSKTNKSFLKKILGKNSKPVKKKDMYALS